ncbi:hypothetical protein B6N25_08380 [Sphingobacteriales bacterium TSM_CSS]|nr:hypothetical protein B6N25_08380 [Sphingobacteriales bacterium TSM_CSS]
MNPNDQILIEKYLNGELTEQEALNFEQRLQNEPDLLRATFADMVIDLSLRPHPLVSARNIVDILGDDLYSDTAQITSSEKKPDTEKTYNLQELLSFFQPLQHLETAAFSRSADTETQNPLAQLVVMPENGINVVSKQLLFDFDDAVEYPMELSILNNREQVVLLAAIPAQVYNHTLNLEALNPGRYYWHLQLASKDRKINRKYGTVTGYFFVNKEVLPR